MHIAGSISDEGRMGLLAPERGVPKKVGDPILSLAVSDPSGIRVLDGIRIDDPLEPVSAATDAGLQGVSAPVASIVSGAPRRLSFAVDLVISGTRRLQFLPFAESLHVHLISPWPSPSFSGAFSPSAAPQVGPDGFTADWRVLQTNPAYPALCAAPALT